MEIVIAVAAEGVKRNRYSGAGDEGILTVGALKAESNQVGPLGWGDRYCVIAVSAGHLQGFDRLQAGIDGLLSRAADPGEGLALEEILHEQRGAKGVWTEPSDVVAFATFQDVDA